MNSLRVNNLQHLPNIYQPPCLYHTFDKTVKPPSLVLDLTEALLGPFHKEATTPENNIKKCPAITKAVKDKRSNTYTRFF